MTAWRVCVDFGTAWSKAAIAPVLDSAAGVQPLAINLEPGANPFLAPCAVFVDELRVLFGAPALRAAEATSDQGREALLSFKTLLSAGDIEALLMQQASRAIDPHRVFRNRDLVALYIAHLMHQVRVALPSAGVGGADTLSWRYTTPGWRSEGAEAAHAAISTLLDQGVALSQRFGGDLVAPTGINISDALSAIEDLKEHRGARLNARPLLEASAAAACHLSGAPDAVCLLALDMGAGTTDIGAVCLKPTSSGPVAMEAPGSRRTLKFAGDLIDRLLMNIVIEKAGDRSVAEQSRLWRQLLTSIRAGKETLFLERKAVFRHPRKAIMVSVGELTGDRDFKHMLRSVAEAYQASLNAAASVAAAAGASEISVVLAGGGAGAPFLRDLMKKTAAKDKRIKVRVLPPVPDWANDRRFDGDLAPVFPQLAIAMGGAIASEGLMMPLAEPESAAL